MNTDVLARLICAAFLFYPAFSALSGRDSLAGQMASVQNDGGMATFILQTFVAAMIMIDVLINELMTERFSWRWLMKRREHVYLLGAFSILVVPFTVSKYINLSWPAIYLYTITAIALSVLAWCDTFAKTRCSRLARRKEDRAAAR